jgi:tetratricopeptide (TPR) repeat protein
MAKSNKDNLFSSAQGIPSEKDLFLGKTKDSPNSEDLFTVPFDPTGIPIASGADTSSDYPANIIGQYHKRISNKQTLLVAGIAVVAFVLVYTVFFMDGELSDSALMGEPNDSLAAGAESPTAMVSEQRVTAQVTVVPPVELDEERPLSRAMAENLYGEMAFERAYEAYTALRQGLSQTRHGPALEDFFVFRMALCQKGMGNTDAAKQLLRSVSQGNAPAVRSMARYHEALLLLYEKQYWGATTKAYQALALIDAVENAPKWVQLYKRYCDYLISKAVTSYALSLYDAERELPEKIFTLAPVPDPFLNLNDQEFVTLLESGCEALERAMLGPRISSVGPANATPLWRVVANGAPLEETFTRFVTHAGFELDWSYDLDTSTDMISEAVRSRPVHVLVSGASSQRIISALAGCAGLLASIDQGNTIHIHDPEHYSSSSERASSLAQGAIDLCEEFLLANTDPKHAANAYLALGLLKRHTDQVSEALAAYRQIFNRFPRHELAPYALLHSSRLKTDMGDLLGAKTDLELLVEQYPDVEFSGNAHIYLANATMNANYWTDAIALYRKVYNLNMSQKSRAQAAYGAGQCCFRVQDYEGVVRWLNRFEESANGMEDQTQLKQALIMRAQACTELGRNAQASELFEQALESDLSKTHYVQALAGYAEANQRQENFLKVLNRISAEHPWSFSYQDRNRVTLIKAQVFQAMGLNNKAVGLLEDQISFLRDPNQIAEAYLQLAQCYTLSGDPRQAKNASLQGLMTEAERPLINLLRFQLAETLLQIGQPQETIRHCEDILTAKPNQSFKNRIYGLMAQAYKQDDKYEMALTVLLNQVREKGNADSDPGSKPDATVKYSMN